MAKPAKKSATDTKITRISASDTSKKTVEKKARVKPAIDSKKHAEAEKQAVKASRKSRNPFAPVIRYIKGSWYELRQVRWPDRRSTWGMTGALIAFTLFFVVVIILLDYGFAQLFKLILGTN